MNLTYQIISKTSELNAYAVTSCECSFRFHKQCKLSHNFNYCWYWWSNFNTFSLTKLYLYPLNWALGSNSSLAIDNDLHKLTLRSLQTQPRSWWRSTGSRPLPSYLTGRLFWPLSQQCLNLMSDPDATLLRLYFLLCKLIVCALTHTAPGNQTQ